MNYIEPERTYLTPKDWNINGLSIDSLIEGCETFGRKYRFIKTPDELDQKTIDHIFTPDEYGHEKNDVVTPFLNGKAWLFETMQSLMPSTYNLIINQASDLIILEKAFKGLTRTLEKSYNLFFVMEGRIIGVVCPIRSGIIEADQHYEKRLKKKFPGKLLRALFYRTEGLHVPFDVSLGLPFKQMPNIFVMRPFEEYAGSYNCATFYHTVGTDDYYTDEDSEERIKQTVDEFYKVLPEIRDKGIKHSDFYCFLDTRPENVWGANGDQLFVCEGLEKKQVYIISDGNIANIKVLADPLNALDQYMAHTLLRKSERFDFGPFCEKLS